MPLIRRASTQQQPPIANLANFTIDNTYGLEESATLSDCRRAINDLITALRAAGILRSSVSLQFSSFGDQQGVFWYLGTNGLSQNWVNPVTLGALNISASSLLAGTVNQIVDRASNSLWYTANSPNQSVVFDLWRWRLTPTDYVIRHSGETGFYLRNWKLQGSNDNATWIDLDTRSNNTTINAINAWGRFSVSGATASYRYLRLLQTGVNSNNDNFLVLAEVEFYGVLSSN